jgi:membrane-associated protease RseP (regulator of RpoE activity)
MKKLLALTVILLPLTVFAEEAVVGYLGISGRGLNEAMQTALGLEYGVLVEKVYEDSPAELAGINIGDVIVKIDSEKMADFECLRTIVQENPEKTVKIEISRSGKDLSKTVELGQREKKRLKIDIDIPDICELKELFGRGKEELQDELEGLKKMVEDLKAEVEELKKQIK